MVVAVTGMAREARIIGAHDGETVIGAGRSGFLGRKLETALAKGTRGILSIGIAGGLAPELNPGSCVVAQRVVAGAESYDADEDWLESLWQAVGRIHPGTVAGSDTVLTRPAEKTALFRATGALAVDMESHIVARAARAHGIPFAVLRIVADPAHRALPRAAAHALTVNGKVNIARVAASALLMPWQIPALVEAGRASQIAFHALFRCRNLLGRRLGFPDIV